MKELLADCAGGLVDKLLDLDDMYDAEGWRYDFARQIWLMEQIIAGDHSLPSKGTMLRAHINHIEFYKDMSVCTGLQESFGWRGRWNEEFRSRFDAIVAACELLNTFAHTGD